MMLMLTFLMVRRLDYNKRVSTYLRETGSTYQFLGERAHSFSRVCYWVGCEVADGMV